MGALRARSGNSLTSSGRISILKAKWSALCSFGVGLMCLDTLETVQLLTICFLGVTQLRAVVARSLLAVTMFEGRVLPAEEQEINSLDESRADLKQTTR